VRPEIPIPLGRVEDEHHRVMASASRDLSPREQEGWCLPCTRRSDYQRLAAWRRGTILGARSFGLLSPVVVPMAFSDLGVLDEIRSGLAVSE
jgi:hypothetical protein